MSRSCCCHDGRSPAAPSFAAMTAVIEAVSERSTSRLLRPWQWPIPLLAVWPLRPLRHPRRWPMATPWHLKRRGIARWCSPKWPGIKVGLQAMDIMWPQWLIPKL
eukprot:s977_g11.t1